jgi:hypothetical protein
MVTVISEPKLASLKSILLLVASTTNVPLERHLFERNGELKLLTGKFGLADDAVIVVAASVHKFVLQNLIRTTFQSQAGYE